MLFYTSAEATGMKGAGVNIPMVYSIKTHSSKALWAGRNGGHLQLSLLNSNCFLDIDSVALHGADIF